MNQTFKYQLAQLEALAGSVDVRIMHKGIRTPDRWVGVGLPGIEIGGDGALVSVSGHGGSIEEAVDNLFARITNLGDGLYLVKNAGGTRGPREAFRFDRDFGSWLRVEEEFDTFGSHMEKPRV